MSKRVVLTLLCGFGWFALGICTGLQMAAPSINPLGLILAGISAVWTTGNAIFFRTP